VAAEVIDVDFTAGVTTGTTHPLFSASSSAPFQSFIPVNTGQMTRMGFHVTTKPPVIFDVTIDIYPGPTVLATPSCTSQTFRQTAPASTMAYVTFSPTCSVTGGSKYTARITCNNGCLIVCRLFAIIDFLNSI
jgi:hypothetical protein